MEIRDAKEKWGPRGLRGKLDVQVRRENPGKLANKEAVVVRD